ncbi:MAG: hypothetical protein R2861_02690 [Desulfobacterales bacterium]
MPIDQERVNAMKSDFNTMLTPGGDIAAFRPLPAEADEPEIRHLPRLVVDFNRKNWPPKTTY